VFANIGGVQQVFINGAGAFVVQFALGHCGTVDFGFQEGAEHELKTNNKSMLPS